MKRKIKEYDLPLAKTRILVVEGKDDANLLSGLLKFLDLKTKIQIINMEGKDRFFNKLDAIQSDPNYDDLLSIGIIRDADKDSKVAFQSICTALAKASLPKPNNPLQLVGQKPKIAILILPGNNKPGMLEDICLASVKDTPAMACVEDYFTCLEKNLDKLPHNQAKANVGAFLSSMKWLEIAHFEHLQKHLGDYLPELPNAPAPSKISAFLTACSKPTLSLGIAAKKGYWDFEHPAFSQLKEFLHLL